MKAAFLFLCVSVAVLVGQGALAPVASAQATADSMKLDDATARAHFAAGDGHYQSGRFEEAAVEFMKAYELSKRPALLFNAYLAYRDLGQDVPAADLLRRYLADEKNVPTRATLEARLKAHEAKIAERKVWEEQEAARIAEQKRSDDEARQKELVAQREAEAEAARGPGVLPWVLVGVGGAAIVGGVVSGIVASGKQSDLEDDCPGDICPGDVDLDGRSSSVKLFAGLADGLVIGGVVMAGAGVLWLLLASDDDGAEAESTPKAGDVQLVGGCTPSGCLAGAAGRF